MGIRQSDYDLAVALDPEGDAVDEGVEAEAFEAVNPDLLGDAFLVEDVANEVPIQ